MATTVTEITGASGNLTVTGEARYTREFEIFFDDGIVPSPRQVCTLPQMPAAWSAHPDDPRSFCVAVSARQDTDRARANHWIATASYSEKTPSNTNSLEDLFSGQGQDPEVRLPRVSWATNRIQVYRDRDINGHKICNSAGDPPIPGLPQYESVSICTIKYFVRIKPSGLRSLVNCVNAAPFTVDGEYVPTHCGMVADIQVGEYRVEKGVVGRDITCQIEIGPERTLAKAKYISLTTSGTVETSKQVGYFVTTFLDRGRRQYDGSSGLEVITNADGNEPLEPSLLNGSGVALSAPVAAGSEVWRYYYPYTATNFNLIRIYP